MAWHFAASIACLIAGLICFALVSFGVVTGGMALGLIFLTALNIMTAIAIILETRRKH